MKDNDKTKILLIEDNPGYVHLVQKVLAISSQVGYQIECAERLSTGLEHLVKGEIDVVLLDLGLPDSQGLDTLSKVRAQAPAVPIVVVTGLDDETVALQAMRQGAQDYLAKGDIDGKALWRVVRYAVERKRAEEALRDAEELYRTLASSSPIGVYIVQKGKFQFVNPQFLKLTGFTQDELMGRDSLSIVHPEDRKMVREDAIEMLKGRRSSPYEFRSIRKCGETIWTMETVTSTRYKGERATLGNFMDITEQKKMQFQLLQAERLSAFGTMAAGVAHELLNPMMGTLIFAQYCRKHTANDDPRYPILQDIESETRRCADIVRNLTTISRMGKHDEEEYQKESLATLQKKMQFQLLQAERISAFGTMAAGVAHELLNPMMGMLIFAQYCRRHTANDDPRYPVLADIERETRRCADIVRNFTTISRMGKQDEEEYQKETLATIIDRVVKLLSYRIVRQRVSITQHIDEGTSEVWAHANNMQEVLLNLISNALDAIEESEKKEIRVEVHREGDFVRLTVADSGCGIAPETIEKIYAPFFTTKPVGQGTGLGLTVSRRIIESQGGDITCESKLGVGTTFKILLPMETKGGAK